MIENIFCVNLDIGFNWILKDSNHFNKLDIKDKFAAHWRLQKTDLLDEFILWLESHKLNLFWAEIFYTSPGGNIFLHADEIQPKNSSKLNWVYDRGDTSMNWYIPKPGVTLKRQDNTIGGTYYDCKPEECDLAFTASVNRPSLVNAGIPHNVYNNSKYPRWCVSIPLQGKNSDLRLAWGDAIKLFGKYQQC